jgi:hypothetical protein
MKKTNAGPVGAAVGGAIAAVAGGLAGKGVAESVDPTVEDEYWRENYKRRPYIEQGADYEAYRAAYRYGWESFTQHQGRSFEDVETELGRDWSSREDRGHLGWLKAKPAVHDAWDRAEHAGDPKR